MTTPDQGPDPAPQSTAASSESSTNPYLAADKSAEDAEAASKEEGKAGKLSTEQIAMFVGVLLAVGVAFYWTMIELINVWEVNPNYSHGYVVPFFALGLAWVAFTRSNVLPVSNDVSRADTIRGGIEIVIGIVLHLIGMFLMLHILDVIGLIFILLGVLLAFGGVKANKAYALPVFFLIFMAPLPAPVYDPVARVLQNFASIVAVGLFDAFGVLAHRSGIMIYLEEGHVMEVGAACSGLRSLTAILALAVAIAYLSGRKMGYCALLVVMAAPVAIAVNCLRVFGTGLIMLYIGPEWATGRAHENEGMVMVGVAAAILALIAWMMAGIEDWYQESKDKAAAEKSADQSSPMQPALENN